MKKGKNKAAATAAVSGSLSNLSGDGAPGRRPGFDAPALFIGLDGPISDSKSKYVACSEKRQRLAQVSFSWLADHSPHVA